MARTQSTNLPLILLFLASFRSSEAPIEAAKVLRQSISPVLFVLGDSSTNCGDNNLFYPLLPLNFSSPFCNASVHGRLPDLIAKLMGLPPVRPFYSVTGKAAEGITGLNFGSDPATIQSDSLAGTPYGLLGAFQTLSQQVRHVMDALQVIQLELGEAAARGVVSSSVFLLSFGTDDYISLLAKGADDRRHSLPELAGIFASEMIKAVKELYEADVRKIAVMGVRPLGCAPRIVWQEKMAGKSTERYCVDEINEAVLRYNLKLFDKLTLLNAQLPDARIVFCDVYSGIMEIVSDPRFYGFENVRDACCGGGQFGGMVSCLSPRMACGIPEKHVWWDFYNPTKALNTLLANWSWFSSEKGICYPFSIQQLAFVRH